MTLQSQRHPKPGTCTQGGPVGGGWSGEVHEGRTKIGMFFMPGPDQTFRGGALLSPSRSLAVGSQTRRTVGPL